MKTNKDWLERFLREYEEGANKILDAHKGRRDEILNYHGNYLRSEGSVVLNISINEMLNYPEKLPPEDHKKVKVIRQILNCRKILEYCNRLRTSVRQNNLRQIVYGMARLDSLFYDAGFIKPENSILGSKRGGEKEKKEPAFDLLVRYAWQNSKRKTWLSMWKFLKKRLQGGGIDGYKTIDDDYNFVYEEKNNRITVYFNNEKKRARDIGFRSFERYVRDLKEDLRNIATK
jgi:hypothetical protein